MDPLFPEIPEDLSDADKVSDEDLENLAKEHLAAAELIAAGDEDFLKGASAQEVLDATEVGASQLEAIRAEQSARLEAQENYQAELAAKLARLKGEEVSEEEEPPGSEESEDGATTEAVEVVAEAEAITEEAAEAPVVEEEKELVVAAVETPAPTPPAETPNRLVRRPPAPSAERQIKEQGGTALVAAVGLQESRAGAVLDPESLALAMSKEGRRWGSPSKSERGTEERRLIARADFDFPDELRLTGDFSADAKKIRNVIPETVSWGDYGKNNPQALVASGGLCAPLTPIYTMPNFASLDEPVWDALPKFQADRGGVNVPAATYIGDITTAISNITEANDALGGTFATKSCQDLDCVDYTEVAVQILAHCREYGNLNAMAWPERIQHENELTMAALARTSEGFFLDRIKALSVNVTNGVETLGALIYLVDGITKAAFGIRGRLRMSARARFRVLLPSYALDLLILDTVQTQFDRYRSKEDVDRYLRSVGIDPVYYIDTPSTGDTQLPDSAQTAAAIDGFPNNVQWAIYPEGAFIGVDSGSLELGLVRDSTLNSTNDFQIFGERFRNVARLAPAQAAYWVSTDWCPSGQFPPAGTARTCE